MNRICILILLSLCAFLVGGCVGALRSECYIGVKGQDASITVKGMLAGQSCVEFVSNQKWNALQLEFYELEKAPSEPILCEYDISGAHVIVRDKGIIPAVGIVLCKTIEAKSQEALSQQATPGTK